MIFLATLQFNNKNVINFFKQVFFKTKKSEFLSNTATLIGGAGIAQALPLLFAPLISRLFTAADFSVFGVFVAIYSIMGAVISLKYDLAIMLPKEENKAKSIVSLCLFNSILLSMIVLVFLLIFKNFIIGLFGTSSLNNLILLVPFAALFLSINTILIVWYNRNKQYKTIATNKIFRNSSLTASNIALGFAKTSHFGLIVSQIISDGIAAVYYLITYYKKALNSKFTFNFSEIKQIAKEYARFPKFTLPSAFIDAFSAQLPILMIAALFGENLSGGYFFAYRILAIPIALIGAAYSQTFYQKFVSYIQNSDFTNALVFLKKSWLLLSAIIIVPAIVVLFGGEFVFSFVFGQEWTESGKIASLLIVYIMFAFVSSPTSSTYIALNMQKFNLYFSVTVLTYRFLSLYIGYLMSNFYLGLLILVICEVCEIIIYNLVVVKKLRKKSLNNVA